MNKNKSITLNIKYNRYIQSPSNLVKVLSPNGEFVGEMYLEEALKLAYGQDKDLVQISFEKIPVCKICEYTKYKYELSKKNKEKMQSNKPTQLKILKISLNIGQNDLNQKLKQCGIFLEQSHDVQIILRLKGRENIKPEFAVNFMKDLTKTFPEHWYVKKEPLHSGKDVLMILSKKNLKI